MCLAAEETTNVISRFKVVEAFQSRNLAWPYTGVVLMARMVRKKYFLNIFHTPTLKMLISCLEALR